jgi:hypothetical protein
LIARWGRAKVAGSGMTDTANWWEQGELKLAPYRQQYDRQHRRFRHALATGHRRKIRQLENWLLKSHTAKVLAIAHAVAIKRRNKKKLPPLYPAKLELMADMLSAWEAPDSPVWLRSKKKKDGGERWYYDYSVMWAAQQYLLLWLLEPRLQIHDGQYGVKRKGRTEAVETAKKAIRDGYEWVIRGDIRDCYPSMNGYTVLARLPGPPAALRQILLPPTTKALSTPTGTPSHYEVRRGLPQGAASMPLVVAAALAPALHKLPDDVIAILYVDDFAIFARSKAAAAHAMNTLRECLRAASVGDLELKFCDLHHASEGFAFLGYHIFRHENGNVVARPHGAAFEALYNRLEALDAAGGAVGSLKKTGLVRGWRCSYASWEGDEYGDDLLYAILAHHFPGDIDELIGELHARAEKTRAKCMPT